MSQILKTDKFIEKAIKIHGDKYDYSFVNYKKAHSKIKIICKEHGIFEQPPNDHLKGCGCIKCSGTYQYTKEDFINKANKKHNFKYDYSKVVYKNNDTKL